LKRIIRVFPSRTKQTPTDELAFVGDPQLFRPESDEVHVSVTFTWDKPEAERLVDAWGRYYKTVRIGGPAYGDPGGEFVGGRYVKEGVTFTSRGCPNKCKSCMVPGREGKLRELKTIVPGNTVQDNNLLACSRDHFERVCDMLEGQRDIQFSGGFEAARLTDWHVKRLMRLRVGQMFLAYDRPEELKPVLRAIDHLRWAGFKQRQIRCFVLVGHTLEDTPQAAENRLSTIFNAGALPYVMFWRDENSKKEIPQSWKKLVWLWSRPGATMSHGNKLRAEMAKIKGGG